MPTTYSRVLAGTIDLLGVAESRWRFDDSDQWDDFFVDLTELRERTLADDRDAVRRLSSDLADYAPLRGFSIGSGDVAPVAEGVPATERVRELIVIIVQELGVRLVAEADLEGTE